MKKEREPEAYMPENSRETGSEDLTRPVRVTVERRLPGAKHVEKTVTECEAAILYSETVTGAVRSEDDPTEFHEKREGSMESVGFADVASMMNFLAASVTGTVKRISTPGDDLRFAVNLQTFIQILLSRSGISSEDLTLQVSDAFMKKRQELMEADKKAREKGKV